MASVKIDLGFGDQAVLSERTVSRVLPLMYQRDVEEFLRRWPRTRSNHEARGYLQQLGLYVAYKPPSVNPADTIALLRSAVQSGRVMVVIERARTRSGGGVSAPPASSRRAPIAPSRQSFAEMAAGASTLSVPLDDAVFASKSYSWMQSYDDVSADDLIKYIESVIGNAADGAVDAAETAVDAPTPLGNAEPFDLSVESTPDDLMNVAARGVSEADEAECFERYELDMEQCQFARAIYSDPRTYAACTARAFASYQSCRGY
ncbi:hypothetical protein [Trinickia fusca]|uniref:Uncharacterized protein n=1 Tax=Trinickia fusca TaxID=2419777 RepID=A0A494XNB2_9BURK|nr:hypothetical protein [Trinickia fusca]RKP51211.1 hypothetical protein D7S89_04660 [Trinickia fusca]